MAVSDASLSELLGELLPPLLKAFDASTLSELKIAHGDLQLTLRRRITQGATAVTVGGMDGHKEAEQAERIDGHTIVAQMVGTFYLTQAPGKPPLVKEGDVVEKGQVVGIIEAMKVMNEVESDVAGRVARILVPNQQPVEYGQALMVIVPD